MEVINQLLNEHFSEVRSIDGKWKGEERRLHILIEKDRDVSKMVGKDFIRTACYLYKIIVSGHLWPEQYNKYNYNRLKYRNDYYLCRFRCCFVVNNYVLPFWCFTFGILLAIVTSTTILHTDCKIIWFSAERKRNRIYI